MPSMWGCSPDEPMYVNEHDCEIWLWRSGQRCEFRDADGQPVGPIHTNVVPAIVWALANGWSDPHEPLLSMLARREIEANTMRRAS